VSADRSTAAPGEPGSPPRRGALGRGHGRGKSAVAVIGTGYVGLTTGAYLAHLGHRVVCADVVAEKVERLSRGEIPIFETGLEELVREGIAGRRLSFVVGAASAVADAEFVFLCVPTPQGEDGSADLSYIEAAATEIAPHLQPETVVVNKSTVPVGSSRVVERAIGRDDVFVVSNPEFLREGSAVHDCLHPDRIVIGSDDQAAAIRVASLFESLEAPLIVTDPASAEAIKYASNAFLATKVSFVNAVANLCEAVGADVREVVLGMGYDRRIGFEFLKPGPGWGGSCFGKDTRALIRLAEDGGYDFSLLRGVVAVNEQQYERVVSKVERLAGGSLTGVPVGAWGLAFKARTDDTRDSPALAVIRRLEERGALVRAYDPAATGDLADITRVEDPYAACEGATVLVVLTEWDEFRWLDLDKVRDAMATPRIVDARNLLDPAAVRRKGFTYEGVGRQ
jgi:UDPglucose 6-dehydrogenase